MDAQSESGPARRTYFRLADLVTVAADEFDLPRAEIIGKCRVGQTHTARTICYLIAHDAGRSIVNLGDFFGRNYAAVAREIGKAKALRAKDPEYAARVAAIAQRVLASPPFIQPTKPQLQRQPQPRQIKARNDFSVSCALAADGGHRAQSAMMLADAQFQAALLRAMPAAAAQVAL